jgi:hypothetical protein
MKQFFRRAAVLASARRALLLFCGVLFLLLGKVCAAEPSVAAADLTGDLKPVVYPYLLDPTLYPDYKRRPTLAPTWKTFDGQPQFTALRQLPDASYTNQDLGRVCWPGIGIFWDGRNGAARRPKGAQLLRQPRGPTLGQSLDELKRRGYFLFDIGGYVPGTPNAQIRVSAAAQRLMTEKLGDKYLGLDMGENDGRYLFLMRQIQAPYAADRVGQCEQAYQYFSEINADLGERMDALTVYWYWSYPVKEGSVILTGAETQNRVTSSSIQYAFLRGAGKQYGVHWFGNAAMFSTWDYKSYNTNQSKNFGPTGPTHGNSLNLLRRLLFSHYLYNSVILGYEAGLFTDDWWSRTGAGPLSPLGIIQQDAVKFVNAHPQPGVMQTPVALLLDYYAGWIPARTLTSTYQVWGYLPYDGGDFLTHCIFDMLYPHYEDCSFYHDERGTLCDTPYGDLADVMHSDATAAVLKQYGVIVAAGNLFKADAELRYKLDDYVNNGGCLIVTAENARRLWPEWQIGSPSRFPAGSVVKWADGSQTTEPLALDLCDAILPADAEIFARCGGTPAVARLHQGSGEIILLLSPFGINAEPLVRGNYHSGAPNEPLKQPYHLLAHVQRVLDSAFHSQQLFSVGENLGFITCRQGPGDYTVGVFNNSLHALPFEIKSQCGPIKKISELVIGHDMSQALGYWPLQFQGNDGGRSDATNIAGGDVRLFSVQVEETAVRVLPEIAPPKRPAGRMLALHDVADLAKEIRRRPTFFEHFDGVKVDWTYLLARDPEQLQRDRQWLDRQKLRVVVDFTPGLNDFPDLTLMGILPINYARSVAQMDNVLDKMKLIGATNAIIGTHMPPELGATPEKIDLSFARGLSSLCKRAKARGVTLLMENRPGRWRSDVPDILRIIDATRADNLKFALNTADAANVPDAIALAGNRLGMVLVSAPSQNIPLTQGPIANGDVNINALKNLKVPVVLDAEYASPDEEFRDEQILWGEPAAANLQKSK